MRFIKYNYLRNYKLLISCFIIFFLVYKNDFYEQFKYNNEYAKNENISEVIRTGQIFINKSLNNIISKYDEKLNLLSPKISVVIPLYNQEKYIGRTINTIKNQKMKNIEIIIVNDKSVDNSLKVIKNYQKYDRRIKIINNKNNMGILYSRCIGALSARGKYILPLDNDDMYLNDDVFDVIYNEANENDIDIIRFNAISIWDRIDNFFRGKINIINPSL